MGRNNLLLHTMILWLITGREERSNRLLVIMLIRRGDGVRYSIDVFHFFMFKFSYIRLFLLIVSNFNHIYSRFQKHFKKHIFVNIKQFFTNLQKKVK